MANPPPVDAHRRLVERVSGEQDDLLATLQLVPYASSLSRRLFDQLVDVLVEAMFLGLREEFASGRLSRAGYVEELSLLADRCRVQGLLPLPSRPT
jgi:hypothetical protein